MNCRVLTHYGNVSVRRAQRNKVFSSCRFLSQDGPLEVVLVVPEVEFVNALTCFRDKGQLYEYYFHYSPVDTYFVYALHLVRNYLIHFQILFSIWELKIFLFWHYPVIRNKITFCRWIKTNIESLFWIMSIEKFSNGDLLW